jgi:hypothetical protein
MYLNWSKAGRQVALLAVAFMFAILPVMAQSHLVTEQDLQQQLATVSQSRAQNLRRVQAFFSSEQAQKAFQNRRIDSQQVKTAASALSDAELANLASRTQKAQSDFAAGTLNDRDLIWIILGLVALILIIVAVR